jgi:hypothetical protein
MKLIESCPNLFIICQICKVTNSSPVNFFHKATGLTVEEQVKIALRFYASGSFLQVIGDTLGYNKGTVSRVVDNVTAILKFE